MASLMYMPIGVMFHVVVSRDSLYDTGPHCMPRAVPFPYVLAWLLGVVCVVDTYFIMMFSCEFAEDISAWSLSHPRASDSVV